MPLLQELIDAIEHIAPRRYAGGWDNVGLLIEPPHDDGRARVVSRVLLTIDLTEAVLEEAFEDDAEAIIAYHPVIFSGLKRLTLSDTTQRIALRAVQRGVAVYSPHTALDAAPGGLNDWLLEPFGALVEVSPIEPVDPEVPLAGAGRLATLAVPLPLSECIARLKDHLNMDHLRVAAPPGDAPITTVAVCPGSGGSLFQKVARADLFLTGELRHHDVLSRVQGGQAVILTDHTNTERGYLPRLASALHAALPGLDCTVSALDSDPLTII